MVYLVNVSSLKQRTPSSLSVVFDMYTENPKNLVVNPLSGPKEKKRISTIFKTKFGGTKAKNMLYTTAFIQLPCVSLVYVITYT